VIRRLADELQVGRKLFEESAIDGDGFWSRTFRPRAVASNSC
jgi:hypothetical protein